MGVLFSKNTLGIDIGQSLTKLAYYNGNEFWLLMKKTDDKIDAMLEEIHNNLERIKSIHFTGGRAFPLYKKYAQDYNTTILDEFEANMNGIAFLYKWEKKRDVLSSLIVTIGTGTSIILKDKTFEHIGGTAMGGGMFMALMKLLYKMDDYQAIIELASKGNRYNVDLKVSDIYPIDDNRIDDLFREYTAASLGKISNRQNVELLNKEDVIQSILCIIGENIGMISSQLADIYSIQEIIFCGGLLIDNKILKNMLSMMSKLRNKKAIFLKNSEFAGAIGALLT